MTMVAWLLALVTPMAIRLLVGLGFTAVSFAGVTAAFNVLLSQAQSSWAALPAFTLQIAALSGIPQCLGMLAAAYSAKLAVWASMNAIRYIKTS